MNESKPWQVVGKVEDLIPGSGVCARFGDAQVALFLVPATDAEVYAIGNWDPLGKAAVLSRGIIGDIDGQLCVASPLYKQHFCLKTGVCLEDDSVQVPVYPVKVEAGKIWLKEATRVTAVA